MSSIQYFRSLHRLGEGPKCRSSWATLGLRRVNANQLRLDIVVAFSRTAMNTFGANRVGCLFIIALFLLAYNPSEIIHLLTASL